MDPNDHVVAPPTAVQRGGRFLVSRDSGMRYTSNDAPRGITSIAARRGPTGVYVACMHVRLRAFMRGQDAWPASQPAGQRRVTFTRSCSLLLARGHPLDAPLLSLEAPSGPALLNGGAGAPSSAWHRRPPLPFSPRPAI